MFRFAKTLARKIRAHPWRLVLALLVLGLLAAGAVHGWALRRYQAAHRAIAEERYEDARRDVAFCLRIWPRSSTTCLLAARIERLAGDAVQADEYIRRCRAISGSSEASQLALLLVRAQTGELDEVEEGLWRAIFADHPESVQIVEALSMTYFREGHLGPAMAALNRWVALAPDMPSAWHWHGMLEEGIGDNEQAIEDYQRALDGMSWRWDIRLRLVTVLLAQVQPQKALPHLEQVLPAHADSPDVLVAMARCQMLMGKSGEAEHWLDQALEKAPENTEAMILRGQLAVQEDKPDRAEAILRQALDREPSNPAVLWALGNCLEQQPDREKDARKIRQRYEAVARDLQNLRTLLARDARHQTQDPVGTAYQVGTICLRLGHEQRGVRSLQQAIKLNPQYRPALERLLQYYQEKGDGEAAAQLRQQLHSLPSAGRSPASS